jgi:type IV secretion system protein TrbF
MATESKAGLWTAIRPSSKAPDKVIKKEEAEQSQFEIALAGKRTLDARTRKVERENKFLWAGMLILATGTVIGAGIVFRLSGEVKYVPFVVQTDKAGRVLNTQVLNLGSMQSLTPAKTIQQSISDWVSDWRTVTTDIYAQKTLAEKVFNQIDANGEAKHTIQAWYQAHDPVERAKTAHVEAEVRSVMPRSATSYEVYWKETETNLADGTKTVSYWRNAITVAIAVPKSAAAIQANPLGIWFENVTEPQRDSNHD